ncbi:MAG: hypothetical protein AMXMBFR12_10460 [Candidatus Babeliales bacterium]
MVNYEIFEFIILLVALTTICCASIAETIKQRNTRYKKGIVKDGILYENELVCDGIKCKGCVYWKW